MGYRGFSPGALALMFIIGVLVGLSFLFLVLWMFGVL